MPTNPDDASRHALLGQIHAGLGRKQEALREGERAVELLPETRDAVDGPAMTLILAKINVTVGEFDRALALLERSLSSPGGATVFALRIDPAWDPLRSMPRFQQLLSAPPPFNPPQPNDHHK